MSDIDKAYRLIETNLSDMENLIRSMISNTDPFVDEVIRYSFRFGGKRLRPSILFLAGMAVGSLNEKHLLGAAAIELTHTATLIHDDILDGASIRRHLATLNVRWNSQIGVLAGDLLLTRAMELVTRGDDAQGIRRLADACKKTCEGELRQIGTIGNFDMTPREYFEMIAGKTAPLLACSAELGAFYAGGSKENIERFHQFGHKLGLVFQIVDDVLDLVGESETAGKTLQTDLFNRKPTLPLILCLRDAGEKTRRYLLERLQKDPMDQQAAMEIIERLKKEGAVEEAGKIAETLTAEAIQSLHETGIDNDPLWALITLARYNTTRRK